MSTCTIGRWTQHLAVVLLAIITLMASVPNGSIRRPMALIVVAAIAILVMVIALSFLIKGSRLTTNDCSLIASNKLTIDKTLWFIFGLWLAYQCMQIVPLPGTWLQALSPTAYGYWISQSVLDAGEATYSISIDPYVSEFRLLLNASLIAVVLLTRRIVTLPWHAWCLIVAVGLVGLFQAAFTLVPDFSLGLACIWSGVTECSEVVTGTLVNRNHHAGLIALSLASLFGVVWPMRRRMEQGVVRTRLLGLLDYMLSGRWVIWIVVVVLTLTMYASLSRAALIAVVVALLVCSMLVVIHDRRPFPLLAVTVALLVGIAIVVVNDTWLAQRLSWSTLLQDERFEIWRLCAKIIPDFILTGSGAGTFEQVFPAYRSGTLRPLIYDHAHNDYLQMVVEQGAIGMLLIISGAALLTLQCWRRWKATGQAGVCHLERRVLLSATAICTVFAVMAVVEFVNQIPSALIVFAVGLGLLGCKFERTQQG